MHNEHALVVFSGGQDSTTCLIKAMSEHKKVTALTFSYQQRHAAEIEASKLITSIYGIKHYLINLPTLPVSSSLLQLGDINEQHKQNKKLPASFVPGRNAIFLSLAHAVAQEIEATTIITGVCETDYSGYPDCRQKFINKLEAALNEGYLTNIKIEAPLMYLKKADIFKLADDLGVLGIILDKTLTCYENKHLCVNAWGRGCGKCPACVLRKKGFEEFQSNKQTNKRN